MKKATLLILIIAIFASLSVIPATASAEDAASYAGPGFSENFDDYKLETDANYDPKQIKNKFGNAYLDSPDETVGDASCQANRYSIKQDPTNAENKVLYLNMTPFTESFFHITLKDENGKLIKVKNFELSFKVLVAESTDVGKAPWFGVMSRKDIDTRYNGCTNVVTAARLWADTAFSPEVQRNIAGAAAPKPKLMNEDRSAEKSASVYLADDEKVFANWHTYKLVANDNKFDMYVDGQHLLGIDVTQTSANKHGYLSLVSCVTDLYIDDIVMTNTDTVAPDDSGEEPDPVDPPAPVAKAPVLTGASTFEIENSSSDAVKIGLDIFDEELTKIERNGRIIMSKYYSYDKDSKTLTITSEYIAGISKNAGVYEYKVVTEGGEVTFKITVKAAKPADTSSGEKGGCKSAASGAAALVFATAASAVLLKKKKER